MAKVIILEGFIQVPEEDMEIVEKELPKHMKLTKQENGCIVFKVEKDNEDKNRFNVYEEFDSTEAFENHQKRVKNSTWGAVTKNVIRNYQIKHCNG